MDRLTLMNAFMFGTEVSFRNVQTGGTVKGYIDTIQREDGSGYRFNVRLYGHQQVYYVECLRPKA